MTREEVEDELVVWYSKINNMLYCDGVDMSYTQMMLCSKISGLIEAYLEDMARRNRVKK